MEQEDFRAIAAFSFIFGLLILFGNTSLAFVVFGRKKDISRRSFLMLNFIISDLTLGLLTLLQGTLYLRPPPFQLNFLVMAFAARYFLPSVANVNLVAVNLGYILETRRTCRSWNDSRAGAAALVACPWLYALFITTPMVIPDGNWLSVHPNNPTASILLVQYFLPGLFSVAASALAVWAYTSRSDACAPEDVPTGISEAAGPAPLPAPDQPCPSLPSPPGTEHQPCPSLPSPPGTEHQPCPSFSSPPGTEDQAQPPTAEVAYTAVSVVLSVLSLYLTLASNVIITLNNNYSYDGDVKMAFSAAFISLLRPALFSCLWNLRKENVCCRRYQSRLYAHV